MLRVRRKGTYSWKSRRPLGRSRDRAAGGEIGAGSGVRRGRRRRGRAAGAVTGNERHTHTPIHVPCTQNYASYEHKTTPKHTQATHLSLYRGIMSAWNTRPLSRATRILAGWRPPRKSMWHSRPGGVCLCVGVCARLRPRRGRRGAWLNRQIAPPWHKAPGANEQPAPARTAERHVLAEGLLEHPQVAVGGQRLVHILAEHVLRHLGVE